MKTRIETYVMIFSVIYLLFTASTCVTQVKKDYGHPEEKNTLLSGPFYSGSGGISIRLAVLKPEQTGLTENEQWLPVFIQGILSSDFSKYSAMYVLSRKEAGTTSPFPVDDFFNTGAAMQVNFNHILSGKLRKTTATDYLLQLTVTETATSVQKAVYSKEIPALYLRDSSAIRDAAAEILALLGIELTDAGKESLKQINPREREAAVSLAKGLAAQESGNQIASLSYMHSAVSYDSSLKEAVERLELLNKNFQGGLGDLIQNDIDARNFWKKMLSDFEIFYDSHPPFELVFTPNPQKKGITNYEAAGGATVDLKFDVSFRETAELDGMRQVLKILIQGLARTGRQNDWGYGRWPYSAELFKNTRNFIFKAELKNDNNITIKTATFGMSARLLAFRSSIFPDTSGKREIVLSELKVDSLTSSPKVIITSVNGIDAERSGSDGFIRFEPVEKMPGRYTRNILVYLTRNPFKR